LGQTRTLAVADGAVNTPLCRVLDNPDLDPKLDRQHAHRAARFGTSRTGLPVPSASQ
jgi:hypothetical protein